MDKTPNCFAKTSDNPEKGNKKEKEDPVRKIKTDKRSYCPEGAKNYAITPDKDTKERQVMAVSISVFLPVAFVGAFEKDKN